ncbi:hypothetical protein [Paenibacillus roseipurpureus]|uniref:Uncharacterized protein n=1 Tax=Paenibacillus roseopurpureus TaxID=2918901 RepID=A0AA96LNH6_9BACL|nr:hypothetical protein [Paenibacillus sp. MBLB1832]WNR43781.1 hypothetical protein MJB10_22175 [Paenibacillus sp. MBLB1832]
MFKFFKLPFMVLLASAILFPAYSFASTSTSSENGAPSKSQSIYHFFTYFFNDHKKINTEYNDLVASWNLQDFDSINWDDEEHQSSLEIWKKWFCY